jgi:DinB family protein
MSADTSQVSLTDLISDAAAISNESKAAFGDLTNKQINWKPGEDQWSIGQCFDHLIKTNSTYFPLLDGVVEGGKKNTFWESMPFFPSFFGKLFIKSLDPKNKQKFKAPDKFKPSSSSIDEKVIRFFADNQKRLIDYMKATEKMDLLRIVVSSPASSLITFSLMDAYTILITHEKRHFQQAKRVLESSGFPK